MNQKNGREAKAPGSGAPDGAPPSAHGIGETIRRFIRVGLPYWTDTGRWWPRFLLAAMLGLDALQVVLAIRLNIWSADLFDALERHSAEGLMIQVGIFAAIVAGVMIVNATHLSVKRRLQLDWRRWLTHRLVGKWMEDGSAFRLGVMPNSHTNPDGRIAEDIRVTTEAAVDLAHSLFYCLLLLVSFSSILWSLSGVITIGPDEGGIAIPGHMVFIAIVYSGIGSLIAMVIGRRLVAAADWRQTAEADMRSALVRARDGAEAIALDNAADHERSLLLRAFDAVALSWHSQTSGLRQLILFTSAYSTLAAFFPILVCIPRYLLGDLSLGGLMRTAQAFQQTTAALSWPVDNFPRLAELRASMERVLELHADLEKLQTIGSEGQYIRLADPEIHLKSLILREPDGRALCAPIDLSIACGERIQITGDPHIAGIMCKALAGQWPWFAGHIEVPAATFVYLQQTPRLPTGLLLDMLTYPEDGDSPDLPQLRHALEAVGLAHLAPELDVPGPVVPNIGADEMRQIAFARMLARRPAWVILEEALEPLSDDIQALMSKMMREELPDCIVVASDHRPINNGMFSRTLTLTRTSAGPVELREVDAAARPGIDRPRKRHIGRMLDWVRAGFGES